MNSPLRNGIELSKSKRSYANRAWQLEVMFRSAVEITDIFIQLGLEKSWMLDHFTWVMEVRKVVSTRDSIFFRRVQENWWGSGTEIAFLQLAAVKDWYFDGKPPRLIFFRMAGRGKKMKRWWKSRKGTFNVFPHASLFFPALRFSSRYSAKLKL